MLSKDGATMYVNNQAAMKRTNQSPPSQERDELELQVESLRREVRQLRLEQDLLNKGNELLKKGLGVDLQLLSGEDTAD